MNPRFTFPTFSTPVEHPNDIELSIDADVDVLSELPDEIAGTLPDVEVYDTVEAEEIEGLFLPEGYEPAYAYPLIVWLTTTPMVSSELSARMRRISDRNYLGCALHVDRTIETSELAQHIREAVCALRGTVHVHSERIVLAGLGPTAKMALEVGLQHPDWFGGLIALGGELPDQRRLLNRYELLRGFRVLLGRSEFASDAEDAVRFQRRLWSAGVEVSMWQSSTAALTAPSLLRQVDHWMMAGVERETAVWV